jgi:hypothetical protein
VLNVPLAAAPANEASSAEPTREPMRSNPAIAQLTDEQLGLLSRLSSANVPAADIAQLMERMTTGRAAASQGLGRVGIRDDMDPDTAPPSYDIIDGRVG